MSDGKMTFKEGAQRDEARHTVVLAHNLLLCVLDSQNKHFALGLDERPGKEHTGFSEGVWFRPYARAIGRATYMALNAV